MSAKAIKNSQHTIQSILDTLPETTIEMVQALSNIILNTDKNILEHVKWNSPAFYYSGEMKTFDAKEYKRDLVVFHLRKKGEVLLIFPTGATISDDTKLLQGDYSDGRRMVTFRSMEEIVDNKNKLEKVIQSWLSNIEK